MTNEELIENGLQMANISRDNIHGIYYHTPKEMGVESSLRAVEKLVLDKCAFWERQLIFEEQGENLITYSESETLLWLYNNATNSIIYIN